MGWYGQLWRKGERRCLSVSNSCRRVCSDQENGVFKIKEIVIKFLFPVFIVSVVLSQDHWETAVSADDDWTYLVPESELPSDWNILEFDESDWLTGPGGFGYSDYDDGTNIDPTISVYLRRIFTVSDVSTLFAAILHADYDDGFVAYLNGTEIGRSGNLGEPGTFVSYDETTSTDHEAQLYLGEYPEVYYLDSSQLASLLTEGENVLAVQAHNVGITSSDMSSNFFLSFGITDESTYYGPTPGWFQPPADVPNLFINEFLSSNASSNLDPDFFSFCDWIEIYNSEDTVVNISGYYITDDLSDPLKFQFPDSSIIQPNSFLIVWADGEDYHPGNYITHTSHVEIEIVVTTCHSNFKLNKSGEEIGLFSPYLVLIDSITFEGQITDISYGRKPDGSSEWFYFSEPTPLDSNLTVGYGDSIRTSSPQFLPIGGFYSATQTIELASENTSATIRFTLDGSKPTVNSNIYTLPITINSTTVIRAQVFETGILPSLITTSTYFIDETSDLPVISIGIDPIYLWDDEIGIYTEGTNGTYLHGDWGSRPDVFGNYCQDWERPISMEYYSSEENLEYKVDAGIKIHGGTSRPSAQKSVTIHFRNKYGDNEINYQFFDDKPIQAWSSIMLRTGQDGGVTNFHDGMMHTLIANKVDADRQGYKPSVVFINGEYWGIHNIRERTNSHFIETNHNIDEDNVDMLGFKFGGFDYVIEGDMEDYNQLINFIESNDISLPENFNYVQTQVDINELLNYQILEIYASNWDWPQNNYKLWKPKSGNGKWRWILLDMDNGFNSWPGEYGCPDSCFIFNMVNHVFNYQERPGGTWAKSFLHSLLSNPDYVNEFIQRFATHLNTIYNPERVIHVIDSLRSNRELETPQHIERWGWVSSMTEWEDNVEGMREFAIERPNYVRQHIIDYFNLDDTLELTVDISEPGVGIIQIHDINIQSFPDTGIYFQNIPVRIVAIPNEGYQFVNWQGNSGEISNSDSISVVLMGDSTITAVFEPTDNIPIVINEINYNSASDFDTDDWVELYNNSDSSINISDWQFKDSDDSHVFTIPSNTILQDNGLLVLCKDTTSFKSLFPDVENYMGNFDFGLSGGGELIRLYDQQGQIVDSLNYDDNAPWPEEPDGNGPTLELINVNLDNALAASWRSSYTIGGSPGSPNNAPIITNLYINEFIASNDSCYADDYSEYDDWIELYNAGNEAINIGGLFITDDLDDPTSWQIPVTNPDQTTIQPDSFLVLWADKDTDQGVLHVDIKLSGSGEQIGIAIINFPDTVYVDSLSFGEQTSDVSYGRYPDGGEYWQYFNTPTPSTSNTLPENNPPVLTILLPDATIDEDDFGAVIIPNLEAYFHDVDEGDILTYIGSALGEGLDSLSFTTDEGSAAIGRMVNDHGAKVIPIKRSEMKQNSNNNVFALQRTDKDKSGQQDIMYVNAVNGTINIRQNRSLSRADSTALIVYPTLDFNGDVNIAVTCTDTSSASINDTLILTILPINDAPVITALDNVTIAEDSFAEVNLVASDVDEDTLSFSASADTNAISADVNGTTLTLTPEADWNGTADITVFVTDGALSDTTSFVLTVNPVNDPPGIVLPDTFEFSEDGLLTGDFTPYFNDVDSDSSLILTASNNENIQVAIDTFTVTFTADTNWNGFEDIVFTIDDQDLRFTDSDTVRVSVLAVNDAPVITALDSVTTAEDSSAIVNLSASNVDEDTLSFSAFADTSAITTNVDGTNLTVTPEANWHGTSNVTVIVTDENGLSDTTDFTLTVNPVNDSPEEFSVIYPTVSDTFSTHADNDTLIQFSWGKSYDVDSEINYTLTIELEFFGNVYTDIHEDISDTTIGISSHSLNPILEVTAQDEAVFTYYVHATDEEYTISDTGEFVLSRAALGVDEGLSIPEVFALHQNYPNPFNPITILCYDLPEQSLVNIIIYDMLGRAVITLVNTTQNAGFKSVIWNATNDYGKPVSAGVYLYQIHAGEFVQTKKMVLLK